MLSLSTHILYAMPLTVSLNDTPLFPIPQIPTHYQLLSHVSENDTEMIQLIQPTLPMLYNATAPL